MALLARPSLHADLHSWLQLSAISIVDMVVPPSHRVQVLLDFEIVSSFSNNSEIELRGPGILAYSSCFVSPNQFLQSSLLELCVLDMLPETMDRVRLHRCVSFLYYCVKRFFFLGRFILDGNGDCNIVDEISLLHFSQYAPELNLH